MAYSYLLDLYRVLAEREKDIEKLQEDPSLSPEREEYLRGRLAAVRDFEKFLRQNFHAKLPNRLRKN
jgi:hypothetical protein